MSLVAVLGQFDVHQEDAQAAAGLMRTLMIETQKEEGCIHYAFAADLATPNRYQLSELWESDETLTAHGQTSHLASFRTGLAQLRIQHRTVTRYRVSDPASLYR
jgi:quinol monooxygenase YgiN